MPLTLNIADDFGQVVDGLQQVSVDGVDVENSLRRSIKTHEAAKSGGKYLSSDVVFHLDTSQHPNRPAIGGQLTDADNEVWTILEVAKQTFGSRWRCICRQLYIDPSLTVNILHATYAKGETGAQEPTWNVAHENVVARIQIDSEKVETDNDYRTSRQLASVYFTAPQTLNANNRIVGPAGEVLKVLSWEGLDDITKFFMANCEVSQWPQG